MNWFICFSYIGQERVISLESYMNFMSVKLTFNFISVKRNLNLQSFCHIVYHIWVNVFKNGPSKICGRQPCSLPYSLPYHKFFKGCLIQILLGPFLNTLTYMSLADSSG